MTEAQPIGRLLRDRPAMFHPATSDVVGLHSEFADTLACRLPAGASQFVPRAAGIAALDIMTTAVATGDPGTRSDGLAQTMRDGSATTTSHALN